MKSYVKRPYVIKALQWDGTINQLQDTEIRQHMACYGIERGVRFGVLRTLEGDMKFHEGDYIVKGVCGEIYPVKKEIFEKTYRELSESKYAEFKDGPGLEEVWGDEEKQNEESNEHYEDDYIRALKERNLPKKPKEVNEEEGHFVCPQCDHAIYFGDCPKEDHKYCLNCGQHLYWNGLRLPEKVVRAKRIELRKGYCPNCDWPVNDNDEKEECTRCGQKLDWSTENDE